MAEITASMVKELREKTDAPMMECKKALTEAAGDMAKAEEILRVKLGNKASKAATRIAAEGVVAIHIAADGKLGSIFEINSETDFVAKNETFQAFVASIGKHILAASPADIAALLEQPFNGDSSKTVLEYLNASIAIIGENLQIRRFVKFDVAGDGCIGAYIPAGG